jgi:hypothetical protein
VCVCLLNNIYIFYIVYTYYIIYIYILTVSPLGRASPNGAESQGSQVEDGDSWVHGDVPGSIGLKSRPAQTSITFRNGNVCVCVQREEEDTLYFLGGGTHYI